REHQFGAERGSSGLGEVLEPVKASAAEASLPTSLPPLPLISGGTAAAAGGGGGDGGGGGGGGIFSPVRGGGQSSLPSPRSGGFRAWGSVSAGRAVPGATATAAAGADGGSGGSMVPGDAAAAAAAADVATTSVADAAVEAAAAAAGGVARAATSSSPSSLYDYFFGSSGIVRRGSSVRESSIGGGGGSTPIAAAAATEPTVTEAAASPPTQAAAALAESASGQASGAAAARKAGPPDSPAHARAPSLSAGGCSPSFASPAAAALTSAAHPNRASTGGAVVLSGGAGAAAAAAGAVSAASDVTEVSVPADAADADAAVIASPEHKVDDGNDGGNDDGGGGDDAGGGCCSTVRPVTLLAALLQDLRERCGLLHLALPAVVAEVAEWCNGGGGGEGCGGEGDYCGLVASWRQEVVAVVEPGPEADRIFSSLAGCYAPHHFPSGNGHPRCDPSPAPSSLSSLFAAARGGPLECPRSRCCYSLLARQEVWHGGSTLATLLIQVCRPAALLRPSDLAALAPQLGGMIVTAASPLPAAIRTALLSAGAAAVVCPDTPLAAVSTESTGTAHAPPSTLPTSGTTMPSPSPQPVPFRRGSVARESISFGGCLSSPPQQQPQPPQQQQHLSVAVVPEEGAEMEGDGGCGGGGSGVVAGADVAAVVEFYEVLVRELLAGASVRRALDAAELRQPALRGRVAFHHL
ncbi:hypothetical protein Agub_g2102, partial [Astrephomene gubernaculifera]